MKGSGGTEGGVGKFVLGFALSMLALYLFFDSVRVTTSGFGWVSGAFRSGHRTGGFWDTSSMGIVFVPFFIGVVALFYDSAMKWAWWLMWGGLGVIVLEIFSRLHFLFSMKTTHLLGMIVLFAAGAGLMIRSYRPPKSSN